MRKCAEKEAQKPPENQWEVSNLTHMSMKRLLDIGGLFSLIINRNNEELKITSSICESHTWQIKDALAHKVQRRRPSPWQKLGMCPNTASVIL